MARLCADANDAHANHAPYSLVRVIFRNAPETSARYATASAAASRQRASAEAIRSAPMRRTTRLAKEARRERSRVRNRHPRNAAASARWSMGARTACAAARWRAERVAPSAHARNARAAVLCATRHTSARARLVCDF